MDCGADGGLGCQIINLVIENDESARRLFEFLLGIGGAAVQVPSQILDAARQHLGNLVALGVFCFGIWKWWVHRQRILHQRLSEYLNESDVRLLGGRTYVLDAIQRPGPGQKFGMPLFVGQPLRNVLRERNWHRPSVANSVEKSADWELVKTIDGVRGQLEIAKRTVGSLQLQIATANILRGAIASASAEREKSDSSAINLVALNHFRSALDVPEHEECVLAKELEAHQLRKLGYMPQALSAYEDVERLAPRFGDLKTQRMTVARSKRYQAELIQAMARQAQPDGSYKFAGVRNAWILIRPGGDTDTAQRIRSRFLPYEDWDLLDQGDLHYFSAFVAHNLGFGPREASELTAALAAYSGVIQTCQRRGWRRDAKKPLREKAEASRKRVLIAQNDGVYDTSWLMPSLNQPKHQAHSVSGAGG